MKLKHKIVSILLLLSIFNFNLVILPAQAGDGCHCERPHGENGIACSCGISMEKPHCDRKGTALSKGHCGLDKKSNDFSIPAHEYPSLLSSEGADLRLHLSFLNMEDSKVYSKTDLLPIEHPPSIL
ncbi:MAG: hypothetical protein HY786_07900 [Deltaproteobacteria bacterium]|nr:hypothetical protein [Deltaproteobacteria bacterium]